jgi:hypothetical protein
MPAALCGAHRALARHAGASRLPVIKNDHRPICSAFRRSPEPGHAALGLMVTDAITIKRSLPHDHVAAVLGTLRRILIKSAVVDSYWRHASPISY